MSTESSEYLKQIQARLSQLEADFKAATARNAPFPERRAIVEEIGEVAWQAAQRTTHVLDQDEAAREQRAAEDAAWREQRAAEEAAWREEREP